MPKEAEDLLAKVKSDLKKSHPDWSKDKIDSTAHATVVRIYKDRGMKNPFN